MRGMCVFGQALSDERLSQTIWSGRFGNEVEHMISSNDLLYLFYAHLMVD